MKMDAASIQFFQRKKRRRASLLDACLIFS
jgi:hypothetical protein